MSPADLVVIECAEYDYIEVDAGLWLGDNHKIILNSELNGHDILRASFRNGVLTLQATSHVGVIPINDRLVLQVRPRVPIANLTRMVIETGHKVTPLLAFREYSGHGTANDWIMDLYAEALLGYVDEVLDQGLLRAYERHEDEGHFPHGHIDIGRTIQRFAARGVPNKAAYSWFERSVDTPVNRCVKAAMEVIHAHLSRTKVHPHKGDRLKLARLAGQLLAFEEVADDVEHRFLDDLQVQALIPLPDPRSYYRPVLDLCVLILGDIGFALELGGSDLRMSSLLIDTNKLFEKFVRVSLAKHAATHGWPVAVLDGNAEGMVDLYDVPSSLPAPLGSPMQALASVNPGKAQPDIVLRAVDGSVPLVAEVKNTVHGRHSVAQDVLPERDEVEQAVTYALRFGLDFALLVHPWIKGTKGLVYVGRVRSIDVYDYRLDLSTEEGTDAALAQMANAVGVLAGMPADQAPTSG